MENVQSKWCVTFGCIIRLSVGHKVLTKSGNTVKPTLSQTLFYHMVHALILTWLHGNG